MYKGDTVCFFFNCCLMVCDVLQYKDRLEREKFLQDLQKRIINCPVNPDIVLFSFICLE